MQLEPEPQRYPAIDFVKAVAIVAVVFTHACLPPWDPRATRADLLLGMAWTAFHVPSFLILSGFLWCRPRYTGAEIRRRFGRFLVPYLLASALVQVAGLSNAKSLGDVLAQFLTASSLGIYYYVFLLAFCTLFTWPLSRMSRREVGVLLVALYAFAIAEMIVPELVIDRNLLWAARNPLHFSLAYFVMGWFGALCLPELQRLHAAHGLPVRAACAAVVGLWAVVNALTADPPAGLRVLYILGAFGLLASVGTALRPRAKMRFLSDATLGLYLYHYIFILLLQPALMAWPPLARILALVLVGLGSSALLCLGARVLLGGRRARLLLGA